MATPNTITGINDDIISQAVLEAFVAEVSPLSAFTTNFNSDAARPGDKVSILRTAAAAVPLTKESHVAYTVQAATSDAIELSLGQPVYVSWSLDDVERASSSVLNMETYGIQKGAALAKAVFQGILGEVTAANFSVSHTCGAADFDLMDALTLVEYGSQMDMPLSQRSMVLSVEYYTHLLSVSGIIDSSAFGSTDPIRRGVIGQLFGMTLYQSNIIPVVDGLRGFLAHPSGLAVAMRYLQPQEGNTYYRAEPMTDPSGITLGIRDWYANDIGRRIKVMECIYAQETGISSGIVRLTS